MTANFINELVAILQLHVFTLGILTEESIAQTIARLTCKNNHCAQKMDVITKIMQGNKP